MEKVKERGILDIAVYANFPPYTYRSNGKTMGIDVDIGRALASELGVTAVIRLVGADETMEDDLRNNIWKGHYLGGGVADVMLHVPVDPEFSEQNDRVAIIGPYHREEIVLASDPLRVGGSPGLNLFTEHKIGVELDTLADFFLLSAFHGGLRENVVHFRNVGEAIEAMRAGKVAGVMAPRGEIEAGIGRDLGKFPVSRVQMRGFRNSAWDLGLAVKSGFADLAQALDRAMEKLRASGELARIFQAHGITHMEPSVAAVKMSSNTGHAH